MTDLVQTLVETQTIETLEAWRLEALDAVRAGDYITTASAGGGVSYAKARAISPMDWLRALTVAVQRIKNPAVVATAGQCSTVIFTRTFS